MNLTKTDYPLGWTPCEDPVNGDPNGLLRMDNLQRDEKGALTLVRGYKTLATFSDYVSDLYSTPINAQEVCYAGLNINGHSIYRSDDGNFDDAVLIGNGNNRACFGNALGQTLITAGSTRIKDDGTTVRPLGLATPAAPTVGAATQPVLAFFNRPSQFGNVEVHAPGNFLVQVGLPGTGENDDYAIEAINDTISNLIVTTYILAGTVDSTQIPTFTASDPNNDIFEFFVAPSDPTSLQQVQVDVILDNGLTGLTALAINNCYTYVWTSDALNLTQGPDAVSWLSINRGAFQRIGSDPTLDWRHVTGIRYSLTFISYTFTVVGGAQIIGGAQGQLNGTYQYVQVNVANNGQYLAFSPASLPTQPTWIINGAYSITAAPATDPQVNEAWIFRISSVPPLGPIVNPSLGQSAPTPSSFLDQYYRVAVTTPGGSIVDNLSDNDAIQIDIIANLFLQTMVFADTNGLTDNIFMIAGLFKNRTLYMGEGFVYVSDSLNPDAIDTRFIIKAFGGPSEKNLWLKKINNNVLMLGTTKDLYEITGTFELLSDGSIDITITPIGEAYPPLSYGAAVVNGGIFYIASDGLRVTLGSNSNNVSPQLRLLFQGEARVGVPPFAIVANDNARYSLTAGKTKVFFSMPCQDGTRRLIIFDTVTNQFSLRYTDPITVYATQTDRVLLGYGQESIDPMGVFGVILQLDTGTTPLNFNFQTVYDANQQPRNRKDTFTLKLICDTGGSPISVQIDKDNNGIWTQLGTIACNGLTTNYFPLNGVTLGFRYALRLQDINLVSTFRLYEYTIEYEPRPEQLDYLRLLPTNLNSYARKRWTSFAYVIDTLGNSITFQPYVDNGATGAADSFNTQTKLTHITYFDAETIGTDMGGIFSGGVFEFYGVNLEETVSEKLPTPTEFLIIPPNDYGTPHRKRHTSYKFQIITRGKDVQFTPLLDGNAYSPRTYNTTIKKTVEYFFDLSAGDVIGIDIGGTLQSGVVPLTPFEFYGVVVPEKVEVLPDRLEFYRIPNSNLGVAARKRVRTLPFVIDTYGSPVSFAPIVDGVLQSSTTIVTSGKTTAYYFFSTDVFGTDFGAIVQSTQTPPQPFEFYELGQPEDVEVLPVPKLFDQIGPLRFDKIGKLFNLRTRLISTGDTSIPLNIYGDTATTLLTNQTPIFTGTIPVIPNTDQAWQIDLPKSINTNVCRLVLGPTVAPFHRYDMYIRVAQSGMETDAKWIPAR